MWRGEIFPTTWSESANVRAQIELESVPDPEGGPPRSFLELSREEQSSRFRARLKVSLIGILITLLIATRSPPDDHLTAT